MRMKMMAPGPEVSGKALNYFAKNIRTLWELLSAKRKAIALILASIVAVRLLELCVPYLFKLVTNEMPAAIAAGAWTERMELFLWAAILIEIVNKIAFDPFVKEVTIGRLNVYVENHFPVAAHAKLMAMSVGYHSRNNTGEKISKIDKGISKLVTVSGDLFVALLPQIVFLIFSIILVFTMDWRLGLLFLFPFIPSLFINYVSYKKFMPIWNRLEEKKEEASGVFVQSILNIFAVKTYVQEKVENLKYAVIRGEIRDVDLGLVVSLQKYQAAINAIFYSFFSLTLYLAIDWTIKGKCDFGTAVFIFFTGKTTFHYLWMIVYIYMRILRNLVAVVRMKELMDEKIDVENSPHAFVPGNYGGKIGISDMDFSYPGAGGKGEVFRRFNLEIEPGKKTAIVGSTGSGKTTLLYLLCRLYEADRGTITLDGIDIRELDLNWYRGLFAVSLQDPGIFDDSIRENVKFGCRAAADAEIADVLAMAGFAEALNFPEGLDTRVGERGVQLSGGQKQRLELARALLALRKGAKILLLDEPTSQVDAVTEGIIQTSLEAMRKEKEFTSVVVAHRLATVRDADKIVVIEGGKAVEQGTHKQLLAQGGRYAELVKKQDLSG